MAHCPHCGVELPITADGFCLVCRQALDEQPNNALPAPSPAAADLSGLPALPESSPKHQGRPALFTGLEIVALLVISAAVAGTAFYFGFGGQLGLRAGAAALGFPTLGHDAERFIYWHNVQLLAAEMPADDRQLTQWLEFQGVEDLTIRRQATPDSKPFGFDTYLHVRYAHPGQLGLLRPEWGKLGYIPRGFPAVESEGKPVVRQETWPGAYWLIALAGVQAGLLILLLGLGLWRWWRRRWHLAKWRPPSSDRRDSAIALGTVGLLLFVAAYVWALDSFLPYATLRGRVWFVTLLWGGAARFGIFLALVLVVPLIQELYFRKVLFGRWAAAGMPIVGAILSSILFAVLRLDPYLVALWLVLGLGLAWLAWNGATLWHLLAIHVVASGLVFGHLAGLGHPPIGAQPALLGNWEPPAGKAAESHMIFERSGEILLDQNIVYDSFTGRPHPGRWPRGYYVHTDPDHLLVLILNRPPYTWGEGPNWEVLSFRMAFEEGECVLTQTTGEGAGQKVRLRRPR